MFSELSDSDGIESEISDNREDGEIVVYLGVESVSSNIEVSRQYLDHPDGNDGGGNFSSDLCERVSVDFFGWHKNKSIV